MKSELHRHVFFLLCILLIINSLQNVEKTLPKSLAYCRFFLFIFPKKTSLSARSPRPFPPLFSASVALPADPSGRREMKKSFFIAEFFLSSFPINNSF